MKTKTLLWTVALLVLAALAWSLRPQPPEVTAARAERGPLRVLLFEEGETRVRQRFEVTAPAAGRLRRVLLDAGDPVVAGETVLATLEPADPTPLDTRTRAQAEAELAAAQAVLEERQADSHRLRSELAFAESERQRYRRLAQDQVVSQERLEEVELAAERLGLSALAADHAIASARSQVAAARARLGIRGPRGDGGTLAILAPTSGVVLRRHRESATVVSAGEPLLDVGDPTDLELVADYLSSEAVRIRPGQEVVIEDWGGEGALRGRVRQVEPSAFLKISALGVEEQRVNVIIDLIDAAQERLGLADGFRVQVGVVVWQKEDVLTVPIGALVRRGEDWSVFVIAGGKSEERRLEIGQRTAEKAEVVSGLDAGDEVILYPGSEVRDGKAVRRLQG